MKAILLVVFTLLISSTQTYSQLSGSYTIGSGGNYTNITSAINDLETNGINGPVIFNILNGTYNEQVIIDSIPGLSSVNNITFRSQSGNKNDVMWITNTPGSPPIIQVNCAGHLSFENITIDATILPFGSTARCILFLRACRGISVINCKLNANFYGFPFYSDYFIGDLKIIGNEFSTLDNSIEIQEVDNAEIVNNSTSGNTGVEIKSQVSGILNVSGNRTYSSGALGNFPTGVWLKNCDGTLIMNKNVLLTNNFQVSPSFAFRLYDCIFDSTIISNNFLGSVSEIDSCTNLNIFNNTGRFLEKTLSLNQNFERGLELGFLNIVNSSNVTVLNNILNPEPFPSYSLSNNTSVISDHNVFRIPSPTGFSPNIVIYNGTGYSNLAAYQTASGLDGNSKVKNVEFVSDTDFHLAGASIGDTDLVGMPLVQVPDDIDGHIRNPLYPYRGADEADVPLPVVLGSFIYKVYRNIVTLNWSTFYEDNNQGFDIERSVSGGNYERVGYRAGAGTIFFQQNYVYDDRVNAPGTYHYRLKQIDLNGNFRYYTLNADVVVGLPGTYSVSQNYPNPFNPSTKINFEILDDRIVSLKVYDISGKHIKTFINNKSYTAGFYTYELNAEGLSSGVYYYELTAGEFRDIKRMVVVK